LIFAIDTTNEKKLQEAKDLIMEFNRNLGVDLLKLIEMYEQGDSLNIIIQQAIQSESKSQHESSKLSLSLYDMLAQQSAILTSLQTQIQKLVIQQMEVIELLKAQSN
jgi:hypothetical protein